MSYDPWNDWLVMRLVVMQSPDTDEACVFDLNDRCSPFGSPLDECGRCDTCLYWKALAFDYWKRRLKPYCDADLLAGLWPSGIRADGRHT